MSIGSSRHVIRKDEMLFVPAGQVFSFPEGEVNRGYLCNFHSDMLIGKFGTRDLLNDFEFLKVWGNPVIRPGRQGAKFMRHIFSRLLFDYSDNGLENLDIIQSYLITLLCEAGSTYESLPNRGSTQAVAIANRFSELLFSNFRTLHRVTDYASLLNITPNHLNKTVKAVTGKSPTKWIDEAIILEAKVLLGQSSLPISEIAALVGLDDGSYFTRLFRKYEGMTPSEFRRMIEMS